MSYKFMPYVVSTNPMNMSVDVPTSTDISIVFSTDMDMASLQENIVVQEVSTKKRVAGAISYKDRTATFKPVSPLEPGTTYIVIIVGDGNLDDGKQSGVKSILGYPMAGMFTVIFTTAGSKVLPAPLLLSPAANTVVETGAIRFEWSPVEGAAQYEVQLASVPEMDPLIWQTFTAATFVVPAIAISEGNYFWRVRAIGEDKAQGLWSDICSFFAGSLRPADESGGIAAESTSLTEPMLVSPELTFDVDASLSEILVRLPFAVDQKDIKVRLIGKSVSGDPYEDHGIVVVNVTTVNEGTTAFVRITEKVQEESGEV